jgi:hypothetical protein
VEGDGIAVRVWPGGPVRGRSALSPAGSHMGMMLGVSVRGACAMGGPDGEERALVVRLIGEEVDRDGGRLVMAAGMTCGCADGGQEIRGLRGQLVQGATAGSM